MAGGRAEWCLGMGGKYGFEEEVLEGKQVVIKSDGGGRVLSCELLLDGLFCRKQGDEGGKRLPRCKYSLLERGMEWLAGGCLVRKIPNPGELIGSRSDRAVYGFVENYDRSKRLAMRLGGEIWMFLKNADIEVLFKEIKRVMEEEGGFALGLPVFQRDGVSGFGSMVNCKEVGIYVLRREDERRE
jgi:hypothetical protein